MWELTVAIQGARAPDTSEHLVYLPDDFTYDDAVYFAHAYAETLQPLLAGRIVRVVVSEPRRDLAGGIAEADADVNARMVFQLRTEDRARFEVGVATWREAYTVPGDRVRTPRYADAEVQDFVDLLTDAAGQGQPANPCDARGQALVGLESAAMAYTSAYRRVSR